MLFMRQTGSLLKAGLPLSRSLGLLSERFPRLQIEILNQRLLQGSSLTEGLREWGVAGWILNQVELGETTGQLEAALFQVASSLEKGLVFRRKLLSALTYPGLVLGTSLICIFGLIFFILPTFGQMFTELNCQLPPLTRLVMALPSFWQIGLLITALFLAILYKIMREDNFRMKVPYLGGIYRDTQIVIFSRVLGSQLQCAVPILSALKISSASAGPSYQGALERIIKLIANGEGLGSALKRFPFLFPQTFHQMVAVGEESGSLGEMLLRAADLFEAEVEHSIQRAMALVEPVSTLMVGFFVGALALAMMLPLFSLVNSIL